MSQNTLHVLKLEYLLDSKSNEGHIRGIQYGKITFLAKKRLEFNIGIQLSL